MSARDELYRQAATEFGPALARLARAYEADFDKRRDLLQEIHFHLWRSLERYEHRCSLRTWVFRVAHNVGASHVVQTKRSPDWVALDAVSESAAPPSSTDGALAWERIRQLIFELSPLDRQVIVCYLEDMDAASISEITGLSPPHVAMKIHRIKAALAKRFRQGAKHAG